MRTVIIRGMPETLHRQLKGRARDHGRSLSEEILSCLETAVHARRIDPETWLRRAAAARGRVRRPLRDVDLET